MKLSERSIKIKEILEQTDISMVDFELIELELQEFDRLINNMKKNSKIIYNRVLEDEYSHESELLDDLLYIEHNDLDKGD